MVEVYLYLSKQKILQLSEQSPSFWRGVAAKLDFKFPFVSGGIAGQHQSSLTSELHRLIPQLHHQFNIPAAENVIKMDSPPVLFTFRGSAARQVEDDQFWLAMECGKTALLLGGSASNVIGSSSAGAKISPSIDPVGAIQFLLEKREEPRDIENDDQVSPSFDLSYLWQALMTPSLKSSMVLPFVEGIAVFSTRLPTHPEQLKRIKRSELTTMLVGTPLYVRQVESL